MSGKVWVNRNFLDGYPMYMNGIHKDGELVMLIFIQEVGNEQLSLYYLNLFQILCGLVETALLRALEYQEAIKNRQYVQGTRILKQEYFEERLYSFHSMREENRASYVLLKLEYPKMTLEEADTALQASVRENDVWGISEKESSSSFFHRRTEVPCRSFLQDWKMTASSVMRSIPWRMQIQEKNYDSDSAWSIPDPVTYCLLCAGLAGDKDTSAEGEKYLMALVIFVPFWGTVCVLLLHLQMLTRRDNRIEPGVEKLRVNEEIYKNIFRQFRIRTKRSFR